MKMGEYNNKHCLRNFGDNPFFFCIGSMNGKKGRHWFIREGFFEVRRDCKR